MLSSKSESVHPNVFVPKPSDRQLRHTRDSQMGRQSDNKGRTQGKLSSNYPRISEYLNYPVLANPHVFDNELSVPLFPNMMSSKSASGHQNVFWPHLLIPNHDILMIARRATRATTNATLKAQYQVWDRMSRWYPSSKIMVLLKRNHHVHSQCIPKGHQQAVKTIEIFDVQS
jgi:hypothetical protein